MRPTTRRRPVALTVVAAATLALAGCGGGGGGPEQQGTVTVTPTVTVSGEPQPAPTSSAPTTASGPVSDVKGRAYDLGAITKVGASGSVTTIELDRWTVSKVDDKTLAAKGYPLLVHGRSPFSNQNASLTYGIPIRPEATVLYRHCVAPDLPAQTRSATVQEMAALKAPENAVLVTLDEQGWATAVQNYPVCAS